MSRYEPDDWACFRRTCPNCNGKYHLSGSETCNCDPCENEDCNNLVPPGDSHTIDGEKFCEDCYADFLCSYCGEEFPGQLTEAADGFSYCPDCIKNEEIAS